jgi:Uma2 family endonuclease
MTFTLPGRIQQGKITYEQYLECCQGDENRHTEWVNGEVVEMPPVSYAHGRMTIFLTTLLNSYVEAKGLGVVMNEPFQMKAGPDLPGRSPDVLFVSKENAPRLKKLQLEGPADLVIEVISPESRVRDRGEKFHEYEQGGVGEYWLIDPERKRAEFYVLGTDRMYRPALPEEGVYHSAAVPGLWLRVDWLWQDPAPPLMQILREWKLI